MTLLWNNLIAWAMQAALLVGIGAALPALLRLGGGGRAPAARLLYWQAMLAACLALPWLRPWHTAVIAITTPASSAAPLKLGPVIHMTAQPALPPMTTIAMWVLAAGVAARLIWLALGMWKLAGYRRRGQAIALPPEWRGMAGDATLLISEDVSGPVTFGFFEPVVLLPAGFAEMPDAMRDAILFHELVHVQRRDWLFTLGEEIVRAAFWFHPAIWWVLGEIQLAREQTVDQAVIEMTQKRGSYVDTLLAMAGIAPDMELQPAPLFLRKRHLKQRVMGIVAEARMSKTRIAVAQMVALGVMAAVAWMVTGAIPLEAQAQVVADGPGVSVNLNGSQLMHRSAVMYPAEALAKGVEGTVVVQVRLDSNGEVIDDAVLSGPDELRKGVQQTVLAWHFDKSAGSATRVVNIDFVKPAAGTLPAQLGGMSSQGVLPLAVQRMANPTQVQQLQNPQNAETLYMFMQQQIAQLEQSHDPASAALLTQLRAKLAEFKAANAGRIPTATKIDSIDIVGFSDSAAAELRSQLSVHAGESASNDDLVKLQATARQFDEHMAIRMMNQPDGGIVVTLSAPEARPMPVFTTSNTAPAPMTLTGPPGAMKIGGNVMAANLVNPVKPVYPPLAKLARQQGTVKFEALIGKDGSMEELKLISGPPLLVQAATDAVKQWTYKPTLLNGAATEVLTTIDVNFSLQGDFGSAPAQ